MIEIIYIAEGINFPFDRAAYDTAETAMADLAVDYKNAGGLKVLAETRMGGKLVDVGNGNIVAISPARLFKRSERAIETIQRVADIAGGSRY